MAFFELFSLVVQWAVAGLAACILLGVLFVAIQRGILNFPPRRQAIRIPVSGRRRLDRRIVPPALTARHPRSDFPGQMPNDCANP